MTDLGHQRKKGRPPNHPVDLLRTRFWIHCIKLVSGLASGYAIEKFLDGERRLISNQDAVRNHKWEDYEDGKKIPSDKLSDRNSISQAELAYPNTARRFRNRVWDVAKGNKLSAMELETALRALDDNVTVILFETIPYHDRTITRLKSLDSATIGRLLDIGSFDSLAATVLLAQLAEAIASPDLRAMALNIYLRLRPILASSLEASPFLNELLDAFDPYCKHWLFDSASKRLDIFIPSNAVITYDDQPE